MPISDADSPIESDQPAAAEESTCRHRWVLSTPVDGMTTGSCSHCNETRTFTNAPRYAPRYSSAPKP